VADPGNLQSREPLCRLLLLGGLERQLPPRVTLGQQRFGVTAWPDPRRVADLQVEAAAGEGRREVELPVEEPLLRCDPFAHPQPGMLGQHPLDRQGLGEAEVQVLGGVELRPVPCCAERLLGGGALAEVEVAAEEPLTSGDPGVQVGWGDAGGVGERPEPQGAPGVHHPAEPLVGAVRVGERLLDLVPEHGGGAFGLVEPPQGNVPARFGLGDLQPAQRQRPQRLDAGGQLGEGVQLLLGGLGGDPAAPGLERLGGVRGEADGLAGFDGRAPAGGGQQEVVEVGGVEGSRHGPSFLGAYSTSVGGSFLGVYSTDVAGFGTLSHRPFFRGQREVGGWGGQPALVVDLGAGVDGVTGADQGVAAAQVQPEPGGLQAGDHGVQPQRDFGELDRGGVQVHPVDLVKGDRGLHSLQFQRVGVRVDPPAQLGLAAGEVLLGELPDRLDRERSRPEGRFADGQAEDLLGRRGVAVLIE